MSTSENSPKEESYREIPASILDDAPEARSIRYGRFSRYVFGGIVLAAFGLMGYLALTNQLGAEDAAAAVDVEQLVKEYEAKEAQRNRTPYNLADAAGAGELGALEDVGIQITSDPAGADVEIDAQHVGTTPLSHLLKPGAYILSISKPDFARVDTVLVFVEGGQEAFAFTLSESGAETADSAAEIAEQRPAPTRQTEPPARRPAAASHNAAETSPEAAQLVISSHPAGASVVLDGRMIGRTPLSTNAEGGRHSLRLFIDDFEPYEEVIDASAGQTTSIHRELQRRAGEVSVLVRPWGSIYIDGVLQQAHTDVRYATSVASGEHTIVAVHPTLGSKTRKVEVRAGGTTSVVIDLESDN